MPEDVVIHIVDDEEPVRKSLAFLLTMSGHAARVHSSATEFLKSAPGLRNACLITDLRMPDMSGVELLQRLGQDGNMLPTIVITGHGDVPMAVEAMKAGALDFIEKPFSDDVLMEAVSRAIQQLETRPQPDADAGVVRERVLQLSEREQQVMHRIVAGLPNKTIAFELDISPRTVEVHRANVMAKMQARNLPELVRMALLAGDTAH
ncbi:response regulator FixJ [Nitratireductor rhodophyticola]|uniref:response regulator FixJ n=1 Tax=Nitratireductor rhodophyticola TaxID=2854036 RepID=UPI0008141802|nr:response regulator FixJ [Nitratireductor rhodophyticola]MEC9247192.1 response regulator FixJ [Pseudomonadota bacterium]WPZ14425.1 response regulator FixJ [Nitratireductor rhodophyticola]